MEKIKQDFFSFFKGSSSDSGYGAPTSGYESPEPSYEAPAPVYETPAYEAPVYEPPVYEPPKYEPPVYEPPVYEPPTPTYTQPETPVYSPPSSSPSYESGGKVTTSTVVVSPRRPFLDKMMSDISRVNRWVAKTASEGMAEMDFRMPSLSEINPFQVKLNKIRRRQDSRPRPVMKYINAPDLSHQQQQQYEQQVEVDQVVEEVPEQVQE